MRIGTFHPNDNLYGRKRFGADPKQARKEQSKAIKKVEKAIAESEKKITELENSIAAIEAKLATPEGAADVSLYTEYSELKKKLSDTMDLWTEQTLELEELNAANS